MKRICADFNELEPGNFIWTNNRDANTHTRIVVTLGERVTLVDEDGLSVAATATDTGVLGNTYVVDDSTWEPKG